MSETRQTWFIEWLKTALLEVQEYVKLCIAAARGSVSRPFYARDVMEQIDVIGLGSLTVLWLGLWFLPVGFWLARAMPARAIAARLIAAALLSAVPLLVAQVSVLGVGIAPLALWQTVAAVVGAITGALLATKLAPVANDLSQDTARR